MLFRFMMHSFVSTTVFCCSLCDLLSCAHRVYKCFLLQIGLLSDRLAIPCVVLEAELESLERKLHACEPLICSPPAGAEAGS